MIPSFVHRWGPTITVICVTLPAAYFTVREVRHLVLKDAEVERLIDWRPAHVEVERKRVEQMDEFAEEVRLAFLAIMEDINDRRLERGLPQKMIPGIFDKPIRFEKPVVYREPPMLFIPAADAAERSP